MPEDISQNITCLVLAGGRGRRMNGIDKGLMLWHKQPMIEHVLKKLGAHKNHTMISANRNHAEYAKYADQIIADEIDHFQGPLAGILTAMHHCKTDYLLCVPCDSPEPPDDLQSQLIQCMQSQQKTAAICHDGERLQPLFLLISCEHRKQLDNFLQQGQRKVQAFMQLIDPAICDFSAQKSAFNNFNSAEDMRHE